jgi:O-antigen/teichoic acid export membrane protein
MTESTAGWIFIVGLPVFTFIGAEGKELFAVVFGARWAAAGIYAQRLAPLFCLWMVASPLNHLLTIREWQGTTLGFSFLHCVVTIVSLYAGIRLKSPEVGIAALGIGLFSLTAVNLQRLFRAGYSGWGRILRRVAPMAGCATLAIVPVAFAVRSPALWAISTRFLTSCLLYLFMVSAWRLYPSASWNALAPAFTKTQCQ